MELEGVLGILVLVIAIAVGAVWLLKTVAKRQEKHLLLVGHVAQELALRQTEAAKDSVRFKGIVNGVPIELRICAVARARSTELRTEVSSPLPGGAPRGIWVRRVGMRQQLVASIDGNEIEGTRLLSKPLITASCMQLTEAFWSGMAGTGEVRNDGIVTTKSGTISDPSIIREMIRRVVEVAQAMNIK